MVIAIRVRGTVMVAGSQYGFHQFVVLPGFDAAVGFRADNAFTIAGMKMTNEMHIGS